MSINEVEYQRLQTYIEETKWTMIMFGTLQAVYTIVILTVVVPCNLFMSFIIYKHRYPSIIFIHFH